ncbi:hypothetical protein OG2516_13404 [Oceanicola granulosus HTCC2516]|uniref:BrnA antitoxin of type II toxin-antitoxin system n=1 Tax=Oceanicola granulosus (strain ATCC BAA-861 / DSM 15982 / KCTC 12143 / HTCC2516) TaxID=314256 RepID=Q2CGY7_OCEGH|nr:BrnA antitoxin family protein [Oceanicola granulosus]EAR52024.1 hypothetical protein OG2516_13404 [Oceanicola granulosus HTCC2516]
MTHARRRLQEIATLWADIASDTQHPELLAARLPHGWGEIDDRPEPPQTRVTLRIDRDVAKWFRSYGTGYQKIVARVLRAYMLARQTELLGAPPPRPPALTDAQRDDLRRERILAGMLEEVRARRLSRRGQDGNRGRPPGLDEENER